MDYLITPDKLKTGDKVAVVSPSGAIDPEFVHQAVAVLQGWGLSVEIAPHALGRQGRFCGMPNDRLSDLQQAMDAPGTKAILCSRGGYGVVHLLDKLDFSGICAYPKWLIGYSDITALHAALYARGVVSLHAPMAKHLALAPDAPATAYLREALMGSSLTYEVPPHPFNRPGRAYGPLVGGNLAVMCGLEGTPYLQLPEDAILFVEDIGERPYQIDRMMWQLKLAGVFERIAGMIIGQFTDYEQDPLMYSPVLDSIREILDPYDFPICFGFPVGHVVDNYPMVHGSQVILDVKETKVRLNQS